MESRYEKFKKKKTSRPIRVLVAALFLTFAIGGSFSIAFADLDIDSTILSWFDRQGTKSIETIETAISSEKEIQLQRLREALQTEMTNAEQQLNTFTEAEKAARVKSLQDYADQLIANLQVDNTEEKQQIASQLDAILTAAKNEMNSLQPTQSTEPPAEEEEEEVDSSSEEAPSTEINK
ncbi:hypothetical protein EKG37_08555 [Robertmurraya yapensis]|uniref:DUF5667 domain-containing protein n=2 Tax=Bacillaceae TaxID=186817 RepID=A0A3S0IDK9_9BACI|nr:head completion/stabilization protein [Bacillus yapensis]RTR33099.1 hypothetical protein EKG37_08555 [Bacillus yapensis]TKS96922.1 hypothetical protein FAR12_08555 [Bacillus yapensis]